MWAVAAKRDENEKLAQQLVDKIKSKMDVAKFFVGFITVTLGVLLREVRLDLTDRDWIGFIGAIAVILAGALSLVTMLAYDRLLMPSSYWGSSPEAMNAAAPQPHPQRPPSPPHWVLYPAMIRIWHCAFLPAVGLLFLGIASLTYALLKPPARWPAAALATVAVGVGLWAWYRKLSPQLGYDD